MELVKKHPHQGYLANCWQAMRVDIAVSVFGTGVLLRASEAGGARHLTLLLGW